MRIEMVQSPVRFFAPLPATLIHTLNLFVATTGAFVLLCAWNRDKRVDLGEWVRILLDLSTLEDEEELCVAYLART